MALTAALLLLLASFVGIDAASSNEITTTGKTSSLSFVYPMKNASRTSGQALKLRCEVRGSPPATEFRWFANEAPLEERRGRVKVKNVVGEEVSSSRIRFRELDVHDTGFYRCGLNPFLRHYFYDT